MSDNSQPVFIEYLVEGPATAAAVARVQTNVFGAVIQTAHGQPQVIPEEDISQTLQALDPVRRVYRDAVFARALEFQKGIPLADHFDDLRTLQRLLENQEQWPSLSHWCRAMQEIVDHGKRVTLQMRNLYATLMPLLASSNLTSVYEEIELPVIDPTLTMIVTGVPVDCEELRRRSGELERDLEETSRRLSAAVQRRVNPEWEDDVQLALFQILNLPALRKTRTGKPSTSNATLLQLERLHPAAGLLRQYRMIRSMRDAVQNLRSFTDNTACRAYPQLDPLGTETGRFSCTDPALQSLPGELCNVVVAEEGRTFLELDASQCELRVLANLSQDIRLLDALDHGDVHRHTAAFVLGLSEEVVTPEQRHLVGKSVNFGIIYGQTESGLAMQLDVDQIIAMQYLRMFFSRYGNVAAWINNVHANVEQLGYVETLFGRRRYLPHVRSQDPYEVARARRQAVNTIIQGTAAELIKQLLGKLHRALPAECQLHLTSHDSVLMSAPTNQVQPAREVIEHVIQELAMPMSFTLGMGRTWAECKINARPLSSQQSVTADSC